MEQWREILRAIWSLTHTNTNCNCKLYSDAYDNGYTDNDAYHNTDPYRHDHTQCKPNTDCNADCYGYLYTYRNAKCHPASYSHTETSPKSKAATDSASSHNTRATSAVATSYCVAPAYFATSHNTSTDSIIAASYSSTAALVRSVPVS